MEDYTALRRTYYYAKNELPVLFEVIEKGCIIREIFLDGTVANLVQT